MAKKMERVCIGCGKAEEIFFTARTKLQCNECLSQIKIAATQAKEISELENMGYSQVEFSHVNDHGKRAYTVMAPCCGASQTMLFGNIRTMFKKYNKPPCTSCGGKERIAKAMKVYKQTHGRTYDEQLFEDYSARVRAESEVTYRKYESIINPDGEVRGRNVGSWHLDHKMSIRDCFLHSIPVELAGSILNLTMLETLDNLKKSATSTIDLNDWVDCDLDDFAPEFLHKQGLDMAVKIPLPEVVAEHVQDHLDKVGTAFDAYQTRKIVDTNSKRVKTLVNYGYENVICEDLEMKSSKFEVTYGGRTEILKWSQLQCLMKNGVYLWAPGSNYRELILKLKAEAAANRVISDEERARRSLGQINRKVPFTDEVKALLSKQKLGRKRWYHPDFPSFKQAKECPGDGWSLTKS